MVLSPGQARMRVEKREFAARIKLCHRIKIQNRDYQKADFLVFPMILA